MVCSGLDSRGAERLGRIGELWQAELYCVKECFDMVWRGMAGLAT